MTLLHIAKKEKKEIDYRRIITFDIETLDGLKGTKFALASVSTDSETYTFYKLEDLMNYLTSLNKSKIVFAHNLGFDGRFIVDYCMSNDIKVKQLNYASGILEIKIKNFRGNWIKIRDSYALFPISQDKLLKSLKLKTKVEVDFNKNPSLEQLRERCEYDAFSLRQALVLVNSQLFKLFHINALTKFTVSRLSLTIFRSNFLKHDLQNPYLRYNKFIQANVVDSQTYNFVRESYAGGRVEVFDLNVWNNVKSYDINSLYPFVMSTYRIPIGKFHYIKKITKEEFFYLLDRYEGFVHIRVRVKKDVKIPLLWLRHKNKLIFPIGEFENTYTFVEIREALKLNQIEILDVYEVFYAEKSEILFKDFVKQIYNMRKEMKKAKNPFEKVLKLILNSLYGKFGQNPEKNNILFANSFKEFSEYVNEGLELLDAENMVFSEKTIHYSNFMLVHISSYITALARIYLTKTLIQMTNEHKTVLYCDTDSIFTTDELEESTELGGWKVEVEATVFKAFAPKLYYSDKKKSAKGIPKQLIKNINTLEEFTRVISSDIEFEKYASVKLMFRRHKGIVKTTNFLGYVSVRKHFKLLYDKRYVEDDLTTKPLEIIT